MKNTNLENRKNLEIIKETKNINKPKQTQNIIIIITANIINNTHITHENIKKHTINLKWKYQ